MSLAIAPLFLLSITPTAAGAGNTDHTVTRPFTLVDGTVEATATQAGGTAQISRQLAAGGGFVAVTDAVVCTTDDALVGVGSLATATKTFAAGDTLRLILAGAATNCIFNANLSTLMLPPSSMDTSRETPPSMSAPIAATSPRSALASVWQRGPE